MTLKPIIKKELCAKEVEAVKRLKEKNQLRYNIEYKLDLGFFKESHEKVSHLLCWDTDKLVGYVAMSSFNLEELEVTIITKHDRAILDQINRILIEYTKEQNIQTTLWIIDRKDNFSISYVKEMNRYKYRFSEYAMTLAIDKFMPMPSEISLQPAREKDTKAIASLENGEFTEKQEVLNKEDLKKTLVLKEKENVIASIRIEKEGNSYGIYGFVVRADFRGQGLGRKILSQIIQQLLEKQAKKIYLEVESTNNIAHHLYQSIGFVEQTLFDYYAYEISE
ncbi:GNAT family N-acetyltransferase [Enterococcus caccae]|uniref:N-acetyltransferase domain-containing protein n=1 Tax=Enterococcus caccae ATCC BAA-1240 TaxID=1158612 RepID=R3W9Z5_9ENTE|nr:GNAT family N-acetyltransferase [Enterococcus caccae]EOL44287.1 hypothetical protein UC7_02331 [Enterococcus caccae ATCC BAA-1240]EOT68597.1 hypothetical protein I580_00980 [Enterococcus caccae ATCC BAA-1240]OJG28187.1 hypothetical protein RU98_GL001435 [Enterococcus caccae]